MVNGIKKYILNKMRNLINKILNSIDKKVEVSLLSLHIVEFTNESWLTTIQKQGRLCDYLANLPNNKIK